MIAVLLLALACGVERQAVKTLADSPALLGPNPSTIGALRVLPPLLPWKNATPRAPAERSIVTVQAWVTGYKLEADGDYHVVISAGGLTMVVEFPDPGCVKDVQGQGVAQATRTAFVALIGRNLPTAKFKVLKTPILVELTGVVFMDRVHGQTGVAPNGVELHPVLAIRPLP